MTATELNTQKISLVKEILEETNENYILELVAYFHKVKTPLYPCRFSDKEKKNRIEQSVKDAEAGLGVTEEVMFNRHPEWL